MRRRTWRPRVHTLKLKGRKFWYFGWTDRKGKRIREASRVPIDRPRAVAIRAAIEKENRLLNVPEEITWAEACRRYEEKRIPSWATGTIINWYDTRKCIEHEMPDLVDMEQINTVFVDDLTAKLRQRRVDGRPISPATVAGRLRHLRAFSRWAAKRKYLAEVPDFEMPAGAVRKRSRDITLEELERLIAVLPMVFAKPAPAGPRKRGCPAKGWAHWERFLWGLWHSGLRISELLELRWDDGSVVIDLTTGGKRPGFMFRPDGQKNRKEQWIPMTREFYDLYVAPEQRRIGYVFQMPHRADRGQMEVQRASRLISELGRLAAVRTGGKWASAHDIRRAFATRMAGRMGPWELAAVMRHSSPVTTRQFYVGDRAAAAAAVLWAEASAAAAG